MTKKNPLFNPGKYNFLHFNALYKQSFHESVQKHFILCKQ
jgi:hypothetical protein